MVGNAGVDIFFVISGFIMWNITQESRSSPALFLRNRLIRIVPVYWLVTTVLVAGALGIPDLFPTLKIDIPYAICSYLFVPMRSPGSPENGPILPVLAQGWTLNYEMFFYILFSLCLFLRPNHRLTALSLSLLSCVITGVFYNGTNALLLCLTDPIFLEFLAGVFLSVCVQKGLLPSRMWGYCFATLGVILLLACTMTSVTQFRFLAWGIPAVLLVAGALVLEITGRIPQLPLLRLIGDSSYSLYLTHGLTLSLLAKVMTRSWLFSVLGLFAAIVVGICFWQLIERRLTVILKRWFVKRPADQLHLQTLTIKT